MLTLDGAYGEGGGQIIRSALTLAALTGAPVRLERIRAGRTKPGLRPQHLTAARALAYLCNAALTGDAPGSQTLTFTPATAPVPGEYVFDVADAAQGGSAGATTLVLQTVLLPLALAPGPSRVTLRGGTFVPWSPPALYIEQVYLPVLAQMGVVTQFTHAQWGFYPRGGGELVLELPGRAALAPLALDAPGPLREITGVAFASQLPSHIPQRMSDRARALLQPLEVPLRIAPQHVRAADPAAGLFLLARYERALAGFSALGRRGLPSEAVAEEACAALLAHHATGAAVDAHLADQLVLPLVWAGGPAQLSVAAITRHLLTNVWTAGQFALASASVEGQEQQPGTLWVEKCHA